MSASKFSIKSVQRQVRQIFVSKTGLGSPVKGGLSASEVTITDNGVGDYTIEVLRTFSVADIVAIVTSITADAIIDTIVKTSSSVRITCVDATDGTTAKECDFDILIVGSDVEERYSDSN